MSFSHDRRGQSVVIGTVILFGFLIVALSLYQVQVVPQQNAQAEFEHFEDVRNDLVDLRAGILQAGSTDRTQYQTVRLGTSYSPRVFAINPPPPAGEIRTSDPSYPIVISNATTEITVQTRFIQYRPGYNEIDRSPTWYDASVLYVDARDSGGGIAVIEGQELIDNDENVNIVAVQNEFQRSGTGRITMELRPAESVTDDIPDGPLTVTIPTRLSESDWESKTNITDKTAYDGVTDDENDDGIYNLTLETTSEDLTVDTVGVGEAPEEPVQNDDGAINGGGGTDDDDGGTNNDADAVQSVDGTAGTSGGSGKLRFDVSSSMDIDISAVGIEVRKNLAGYEAEDDSSFTIGEDGDKKESSKDNSVNGDPVYQFDPSVTLSSTEAKRVEFDKFEDGIDNVQIVDSEADADIIVSFQFGDGSIKKLFFSAEKD